MKVVKNYEEPAAKGEKAFVEQYKHPFLVLVRRYTDIDVKDTDFFTKVLDVPDVKDLGAFASGRKLEKTAVVYPCMKRAGANPYTEMITIGRANNCDVVIPSSGISKFHAYIMLDPQDPAQYLLCDAGSRNGTKLNEKMIEPMKKNRIESGNLIEFGSDAILRFYLPKDFWGTLQRTFLGTV